MPIQNHMLRRNIYIYVKCSKALLTIKSNNRGVISILSYAEDKILQGLFHKERLTNLIKGKHDKRRQF